MNKFYPLVSIIIPVYNGEKYIKKAINSALAQTYKNIEIIVVNDGSTDNTELICMSFKDKIKYIKKENGGVSTSLNIGIKNMKGEYFSWLSHDDLYIPTKIQKQITVLQNFKNKQTILFSDYLNIDENDKLLNICIMGQLIRNYPKLGLYNGWLNGLTLLIPKQAFNDVGLFNENLRCTQDYDLWDKMIKKYDFQYIEYIGAKSRIHHAQVTNTSPLILKEGNELWINIINNVDNITISTIFENKNNFYCYMTNVLSKTNYKQAYEYVKNKIITNCNSFSIKYKKDIFIFRIYRLIKRYGFKYFIMLVLGGKNGKI